MAKKTMKMSLAEFQEKEAPGLLQIFDFTSNLAASTYYDTTAVKIPETCYSSSKITNNHFLSEYYLLNRKRSALDLAISYGVSAYSSFSVRGSILARKFAEEEEEIHNNTVALPPYMHLRMNLEVAIRSRRSKREMTDAAMTDSELSTIAFFGDGVTGELKLASKETDAVPESLLGDELNTTLRAAPAGGGLYPVTLYFMIRNVKNIEDGLYYYLPLTHSLRLVRKMDTAMEEELERVASWGNNIDQSKVNVMVFYVYNLYNNSRKYLDMAYDFALIEAGQISENIYLTCTALNIPSCDIGGFQKLACDNFLGLDGVTETVINVTIIGK